MSLLGWPGGPRRPRRRRTRATPRSRPPIPRHRRPPPTRRTPPPPATPRGSATLTRLNVPAPPAPPRPMLRGWTTRVYPGRRAGPALRPTSTRMKTTSALPPLASPAPIPRLKSTGWPRARPPPAPPATRTLGSSWWTSLWTTNHTGVMPPPATSSASAGTRRRTRRWHLVSAQRTRTSLLARPHRAMGSGPVQCYGPSQRHCSRRRWA
mmetsp:Transcript_7343/g.23449  ORF Transcript_7343/g.23449 Transcript_7343/m.23449 type:complete len:209 (-) Transcript_7343:803-1429(-)